MQVIKGNFLRVTNILNQNNNEAQKYVNIVNLTGKDYQKVFTKNEKNEKWICKTKSWKI